jgi:hypothetical protein
MVLRGPDGRLDRDVPGQDLVVRPRHGMAVTDENQLGAPATQFLGERQAAHHMPDPPASALHHTGRILTISLSTPQTVAAHD